MTAGRRFFIETARLCCGRCGKRHKGRARSKHPADDQPQAFYAVKFHDFHTVRHTRQPRDNGKCASPSLTAPKHVEEYALKTRTETTDSAIESQTCRIHQGDNGRSDGDESGSHQRCRPTARTTFPSRKRTTYYRRRRETQDDHHAAHAFLASVSETSFDQKRSAAQPNIHKRRERLPDMAAHLTQPSE